MKLIYAVFILFLMLAGCSSSIKAIKPGGETVEVELKSGREMEVELIMVTDSSLLILHTPETRSTSSLARGIYKISLTQLKSVKVENYSNDTWITPVLVFQVVPSVLFTIAAAGEGAELSGAGILILFGPPVLTALLLASSQPPAPGVAEPLIQEHINELRKYARFPNGLSPEQMAAFLAGYRQDTFFELK